MKTVFTVKKKDGTMWVATQVTLTLVEGDPDGAQALSYVCSGVMRTCPVSEVEEVVWRMPQVIEPAAQSQAGPEPTPEPKPGDVA